MKKSSRTLVIVHVEPDFDKIGDMDSLLVRPIVKYSKNFDHVINVTSANALTGTKPFEQLSHFHEEEWIWGFDYEYYSKGEEADKWIEGNNWIYTSGHEASSIEDWMKNLSKNCEYVLVGGARRECLQDVYDIFVHLQLSVTIHERLTYGS